MCHARFTPVRGIVHRALFRSATIALGLAVVAPMAHAQQLAMATSVIGRVLDAASGLPMSRVDVVLHGPDSLVLRTDDRGQWRATLSRPGRYQLRARSLGYAPHTSTVSLSNRGLVSPAGTITVHLNASPLALDQVVVTAARRAQRLKDVVTTTEVVSRADIERTGASDLAAVLTEQTGIDLQGGHPAGTGLMLQGIGSERVLVLLDGQPMAGRISGVFDISRIPTAMVERVEVIRGPQSTLYGTDAMGGVVNIITRQAPLSRGGTLRVGARATAGSQGRAEVATNAQLSRGSVAATLDVNRRDMEMAPGRAELRGTLASRMDVAGKTRWAPDSTISAEASVLVLDERQRWPAGALYNFADNRQYTGRATGAVGLGSQLRHRLSPTVSVSSFDHRSRASTQLQPIAGDTGQRQLQRVYQAELLYNGRFGATGAQALDIGTQVRRDETQTERVTGGRRSITLLEPYAQVELAPRAGLAVLPGLRLTHSSQWGTHLTPRVAVRQRVGERLTLRASAGEGFRAPDFKELFMRFVNQSAGYAVVGNAALRPESSRNMSAGAEWSGARAYLRGQAFHNRFTQFIETRLVSAPGASPIYEYGNIDNGTTRGLDVEAGVTLGDVRAEGSVSMLSTRNDATGYALLGRPTQSARLTMSSRLPWALRGSATGVFTGRTPMERDAITGQVTGWRDAFPRVDVRLARRIGRSIDGIEIVVGADNLFDRQPAAWASPTPRHIYTALSWSFARSGAATSTASPLPTSATTRTGITP